MTLLASTRSRRTLSGDSSQHPFRAIQLHQEGATICLDARGIDWVAGSGGNALFARVPRSSGFECHPMLRGGMNIRRDGGHLGAVCLPLRGAEHMAVIRIS